MRSAASPAGHTVPHGPVARLVEDPDAAVRALAARDLLGRRVPADSALGSPVVSALLDGLLERRSVYAKWTGAHWRLVSLVELGVPAGHPEATAACDEVVAHWAGSRRLAAVPVVAGKARRCASQEGNAVAVACRLGLAADPRVARLVAHLVRWQWPDGGWNCDRREEATTSSVHETLPALWGLAEYATATGDASSSEAMAAAAECLLRRDVVFSRRTGAPLSPAVAELHYPPYWHADVLQALLVLTRAGFGADPRTNRARDLVRRLRRRDGTWRATRRWWRAPGCRGSGVEAVDWGPVAHSMVTLNAVRVGAATG